METLRVIRTNQNLSLRELAELAGVAWTTIHAIERGTRVPNGRTVRALAGALGVDPGTVTEFVNAAEERRQRMVRSTSYRTSPERSD